MTRPVQLQRSSARPGEKCSGWNSQRVQYPGRPSNVAVATNMHNRAHAQIDGHRRGHAWVNHTMDHNLSDPTCRSSSGGGKTGDRCISSAESFALERSMGGCQVRSEATWAGAFRRDTLNPRGFSNARPPQVYIKRAGSPKKARAPSPVLEPEPMPEPVPEPEPEPVRYTWTEPTPVKVEEADLERKEFEMPSNPYEGLGWKGAAAGWDAPEVASHEEQYVEKYTAPHMTMPNFEATLHDSRLMATYALGGYPGQPSWAQGMPPSPYAAVPFNPMAY